MAVAGGGGAGWGGETGCWGVTGAAVAVAPAAAAAAWSSGSIVMTTDTFFRVLRVSRGPGCWSFSLLASACCCDVISSVFPEDAAAEDVFDEVLVAVAISVTVGVGGEGLTSRSVVVVGEGGRPPQASRRLLE